MPLVLVMLVAMHILALHEVGSNNPRMASTSKAQGRERLAAGCGGVPPYFTVKDMIGWPVSCSSSAPSSSSGYVGYFLEKPNFEVANG